MLLSFNKCSICTLPAPVNKRYISPLNDPGKNKIRCTPRGTKVAIYHIVGISMLNSMHNVVSLATCAESL